MGDFTYRQSYIGLGKETTRGTLAAASVWFKWLTRDYRDKNEKAYNESALGTLDAVDGAEIVKEWSEGKIGGKVTVDGIGLIFTLMFGGDPVSVAKSAPNAAVRDHTYSMANTVLGRSGTIYIKDPNKDLRHPLAMVKSSELSVLVGDYVKWEAEMIGKKGVATTSTPTLVDETEFVPRHVTLKIAANTAGLGAATRIPVKSFKLKVDRKTEAYFEANGTNEPGEIHAQEVAVEGEFTLRYTNEDYRTLWQSGINQALSLNVTNTDVTIGTSANPGFVITMPTIKLDEWDENGDRSKITEQTIKFKAYYSIADAKTLEAVLTNLITAY